MPTYEYKCKSCDHHFDVFHKISDTSKHSCPKCSGSGVRVIAIGGVMTKGSLSSASPPCATAGACTNPNICGAGGKCDF